MVGSRALTVSALVAATSLAGCLRSVELSGFPCDAGACAAGFACHPTTDRCVPALDVGCSGGQICPDTTNTGDACPSVGSFIPCVGCDGIRTCEASGWGECSCSGCTPQNGGVEIACNGVDEDCSGADLEVIGTAQNCASCGDDCVTGTGVVAASCAGSTCVIDACSPGTVDVDGIHSTGCEGTCSPTFGGIERCDNLDNDCNGLIDDLDPAAVDADCDARFPGGNVDTWSCTAGACTVDTCVLEFFDIDGRGTNGCEYGCVPTANPAEICDGADNDCDGLNDNVANPTADCDAQLGSPADVTAFACVAGQCQVEACTPGTSDTDGIANTGCEGVCTPTGVEACGDSQDNDCDGRVDNGDVGAPACTDFFLDLDNDGLGVTGDSECRCSATGNYRAPVDGDCDDSASTCGALCDDSDGDSVPDCRDPCVDVDGDGFGDGAFDLSGCEQPFADTDDGDPNLCTDLDGDTCDDCTSGSFALDDDGTDTDSDGVCDLTDVCPTGSDFLDRDRDGIPDACDPCPGNEAAGTPCGTCRSCDGNGACDDDLARHQDCGPCEECAAGGACQQQVSTDFKDDCAGNPCLTGVCVLGACEAEPEGLDCDVCGACNDSGTCVADLQQDSDCTATCQECGDLGTCVNQAPNTDLKGECSDGTFCNGVEQCTGSGTCQASGSQPEPCAAGLQCDEDNDRCGCTTDTDCPVCQRCGGAGVCEPQPLGDDDKDECSDADPCLTGTCNGSGACGATAQGTDCGTCHACDGSGACLPDVAQDADCGTCEECSDAGACVPQGATDVKNECDEAANPCLTGLCNGAGACAVQPVNTDCGLCAQCNASGQCNVYDDTQDAECGLCEECSALGACAAQANTTDVKNECDGVANPCLTGLCDGSGACGVRPAGTDCGICSDCNATGQCNVYDDTQHADCGFCQECSGLGTCAPQGTTTDRKNECSDAGCLSGNCNGAGACGFDPPGTDCGQCLSCSAGGTCDQDDLSQDGDCPACQECAPGGTCVNQGIGSDIKGDCTPSDCVLDGCNGAGACSTPPNGTPCDDGTGQDGNPCNSSCQSGVCTAGTNATNGLPCDDGFACTSPGGSDQCQTGTCVGVPSNAACLAGGDLCIPECAVDGSGCVTPPTGLALSCEDPVTAPDDDSACGITLSGGDIGGQAACLSCSAEFGVVGWHTDFTVGTACALDGWSLASGMSCFSAIGPSNTCSNVPTLPANANANCCSTLVCPDAGAFNNTHAVQIDGQDCGPNQWRLSRTFNTTGLTDMRLCFDYWENGAANDNEVLWVWASNGNQGQRIYCDTNGPTPVGSADDFRVRECFDLPAFADNTAALTIEFLMHGSDNAQRIYIDTIDVYGWGGGCTPDTFTAFSEDFEAVGCGLNNWTVGGTPTCADTRSCQGSAQSVRNTTQAAITLTRNVDLSQLDSNVEICFDVSDQDGDDDELIGLQIDLDGVGIGGTDSFVTAWTHNGNKTGGTACEQVCVNLSAISNAVHNNPNLGIRFTLDTNGAGDQLFLDNVLIRGARHCTATTEVAFTTPVEGTGAEGSYQFEATNMLGSQLTTQLECRWGKAASPSGGDSIAFQP